MQPIQRTEWRTGADWWVPVQSVAIFWCTFPGRDHVLLRTTWLVTDGIGDSRRAEGNYKAPQTEHPQTLNGVSRRLSSACSGIPEYPQHLIRIQALKHGNKHNGSSGGALLRLKHISSGTFPFLLLPFPLFLWTILFLYRFCVNHLFLYPFGLSLAILFIIYFFSGVLFGFFPASSIEDLCATGGTFFFFLAFCLVLFGIYVQQWISVANGETFSVVPINLGQMVHSRQFSMQFCAPMVRSLCYRNTLGHYKLLTLNKHVIVFLATGFFQWRWGCQCHNKDVEHCLLVDVVDSGGTDISCFNWGGLWKYETCIS